MTLSPEFSSYPIAALKTLLSERVGIELSPIELAEVLWLALHKPELPTQSKSSASVAPPLSTQVPEEIISPTTSSQGEKKAPDKANKLNIVEKPPTYASEGQGQKNKENMVLPVNIPEAVALRNRREISRSLRPLMRKVPSQHRTEIDEEATIIQIAETQTWNPVVKPQPERWLELAIVIEVTSLLEIWQKPIAEFCHVMERQGAFRDVRIWQLQQNKLGELELFLQTVSGLKGNPRRPQEILAPSGRRMVVLLSDCTSTAWRSGKILELLGLLCRSNPVTIMQLLPEHNWDRTALNLGYRVVLKSRQPGALSRDWILENLSPRQQKHLPKGLNLPTVMIQPESIRQWANAIASTGEQQTTGVLLSLDAFQSSKAVSPSQPLTPRQLVQQFRATASEEAQELVDRMAVLPINWSVIRLVQKNWPLQGVDPLQETCMLPLAEIFLSGLLSPLEAVSASELTQKIEQQYDFVDGVRDVLLGAIPISEALDVGEQVAEAVFKQLPQEVQERVGRDIEWRYGESLGYFEAFLIPDLPWGEEGSEIFPFAKVGAEVLRRWGGEYAALVEELTQPVPLNFPGFPPLKTWEIEKAIILISEDFPETPFSIAVQPFDFEVARIEINQSAPISTGNYLEKLDEEVFSKTGNSLNNLESLIVQGTLADQTYDQIATSTAYSVNQVKNVAQRLWSVLSQVLGKKVRKSNLSNVLKTWANSRRIIIDSDQQQGQHFIEDLGDGVQLDMVSIPGGTFQMGTDEQEIERLCKKYDQDWFRSESPQHQVTIQPFFMGRYPITQAQWRAIASDTSLQIERPLNPDPSSFTESYEDIDRWRRPVESVNWYDAIEFCARLTKKTGKPYRLPTEAEWEYACRGKTSTPFHFGETITTDLANYRGIDDESMGWEGSYGEGLLGEYREQTTPVGYFQGANAFGLSDMHGNVWEWCLDPWHSNYNGAPIDGRVWDEENQQEDYSEQIVNNLKQLLTDERDRVLRGGSWFSNPNRCRSAFRNRNNPRGDFTYSLRVVCCPPYQS